MTSRSGRWTPWMVVLALAPVTACGGDDGAPDGADADADIAGTGTVEGYVVLEGETDHSAVSVVIDGTSLTDDSDSTGFWSIAAVPPGTYTVTASRPGYASATSSPFEVRVGETTTVPPIVLHESSGTPHRLVLVSGGDQTGTVGEAFAEPIVVRLEDESAAPLSGVTLVFTPGAASGTAGGTSPATAVTAADGQAQTNFNAGPPAGDDAQWVTVTVEGFPEVAALVVYEDPQPDEPARMTIVSGDAQSAPYGEALPAPLVAYVEDRFANPVWDQPVTWSSTTGGTVAPNPSRTDASGQTAVTATLGTSPDAPAQDFTATAGSVAVTFHAAAIGHRIAGIAPSRTWPECPVDITVEILGEHFDSDAAVVWNPGAAERTLAPTAVAADRIVATLTADLFVAAGVFPITVQQSAGGRCTPVDFVVGPVLPDTGQTSCYDDSAETACPPPGAAFYGQDAQFGWDLRVTSTQRFARSEPAAGEPVVLDRMTQLEWQGCTAALGGSDCTTGVVTARNWSGAVAYCEALTWGGHDDWRLPAIEELAGIVDAGTTTPSVDPTVFPAVPSDWFWSSTPYAESASYAWRVSFDTGRLNYRGATFTGHVLCVRGGPWDRGRWESSTPSGDRVVFDTATGLLWQGCAAGQSGEACADGFASWPTWQEALAYCDGLSWGGYDDWRLPDRNELRSIIDYGRFSPAVDPAAFPATEISTFWTSSSSVADPTNAWYVDFYEGDLDSHLKTDMHHARCVRGAPWGL